MKLSTKTCSQVFKAFLLPILVNITGCMPPPKLSVFSNYLTREDRASYFVGTPDPLLNSPPVGQRLYISWRLPKEYCAKSLVIKAYLRFHDKKQEVVTYSLRNTSGSRVYELLGQDFFSSGGLSTFKVELYADDKLLDEWRHIMWVELITIGEEKD
jgi:hypothetical protein